jgi:hypothetical protein
MRLQVRELGVFREISPFFHLIQWTGITLLFAGGIRHSPAAQVIGGALLTIGIVLSLRPAVLLLLATFSLALAIVSVSLVQSGDYPMGELKTKLAIGLAATVMLTDIFGMCAWLGCQVYNVAIRHGSLTGFWFEATGDVKELEEEEEGDSSDDEAGSQGS